MNESTPETWLPVIGYEGLYDVSDQGRVRSIWRPGRGPRAGRVLKPMSLASGHLQVHLLSGGRATRKERTIHQLVAEAFIGPRPEGMEVRHLDGDPTNNRVGNLTYGTHAENMQDMVRHGRVVSTMGDANRAKTHCPQGHEYTPENTRIVNRGNGRTSRICKTCTAVFLAQYEQSEKRKAWRRQYVVDRKRAERRRRKAEEGGSAA